MIVKFFKRGNGVASGVLDYLLGRNRDREGASVISGSPALTEMLIDSSKYAQTYTSGALSFAVSELDPITEKKLMAEFEQVLMAGLKPDQYKVLWVKHVDKGRVELNFVIPKIELRSGKRLQPYYDRADRPRVNAWAILARDRYGLDDPNLPSRARALSLPRDLPKDRVKAAEEVTARLESWVEQGLISNRDDVLEALKALRVKITRITKNSISLATKNGGKPLRLKGKIYERDFNAENYIHRAGSGGADRIYLADAPRRIAEARRVLSEGIRRKQAFHLKRYSGAHDSNTSELGSECDIDAKADPKADPKMAVHVADRGGNSPDLISSVRDRVLDVEIIDLDDPVDELDQEPDEVAGWELDQDDLEEEPDDDDDLDFSM